jgi:hypothetical protein
MRKIVSLLVLSGICCISTEKSMAWDDSISSPQIVGNVLPLSLLREWNLEDQSDRSLFFQYRDNDDVELNIRVSPPLPDNVSSADIASEVTNYLNGITSDIPILSYAFMEDEEIDDFEDDIDFVDDDFEFDDDDFDDEFVFDDDGFELDDEFVFDDVEDFEFNEVDNFAIDEVIDFDDLGFQDVSEITSVTWNNISWMTIQFTSPVIVSTYPSDGPGYVSSVEWQRCYLFLTLMDNQLYAVDFSAPLDSYVYYEYNFYEAMAEISDYILLMFMSSYE